MRSLFPGRLPSEKTLILTFTSAVSVEKANSFFVYCPFGEEPVIASKSWNLLPCTLKPVHLRSAHCQEGRPASRAIRCWPEEPGIKLPSGNREFTASTASFWNQIWAGTCPVSTRETSASTATEEACFRRRLNILSRMTSKK